MKNISLKSRYISVGKEPTGSYGGSQSWLESKVMQESGCGVIAAGDLLLYLGLHKGVCQTKRFCGLHFSEGHMMYEDYEHYIQSIKSYFPVIPRVGMPGWFLPVGLNLYFIKNRIVLRAHWGVGKKYLLPAIAEMLSHDIPVILSVGPNFPWVWGKHELQLYKRSAMGIYSEACKVKAHYVVATGLAYDKIRISSWGREYYIDWKQYQEYVRKHSNYLVSNICYICAPGKSIHNSF